jgi:hypothetical protein
MTTNRQEQLYEARRKVALGLGITKFNGSNEAYKGLSPADQVRVNDGVQKYILDNPQLFAEEDRKLAEKVVAGESFGQPLEDNSIGAQVNQFGNEIVKEGEKIAGQVGLSFSTGIGLFLAGAAIFLLLPRALPLLKK